MTENVLSNYVGGQWVESRSSEARQVVNPATAEVLARVPLSADEEVRDAIAAAGAAYPAWRRTPPPVRARCLYKLKDRIARDFEALARLLVREHGKTIAEARGEMQRTLECVEVACGVPSLMMGYNAEDIAPGIDEYALVQPLGAFACIAPFNFPAMVPFWFLPFAVACGDTYVVKPSPETPCSQVKLFELMDEVGFQPGVVNLVHGGAQAAQVLMTSPDVAGVSFVGSSKIARVVYRTCAGTGMRVQAQGAAKNYLLVMPDADLDTAVPNIIGSVYGCTGQRCLAGAVVLACEQTCEGLTQRLLEAANALRVGYGLDEDTDMGPLESQAKMENVLNWIERGITEGARLLLDGRAIKVEGFEDGYFVGPMAFDGVSAEMAIANEEVFGPVMAILRVRDFEEALDIIAANPYGNASSIYTSSGSHAREFRYRVECGNIGINVGVAAPVPYFPFGGMKESFFGDLHGQGQDAIRFFTDRKVVIERWP